MAKKIKARSPANATADTGIAGAASTGAATAGAGAASIEALMAMINERTNIMQSAITKAVDDMRTHQSGVDQTSQMGAISTKQDIGADESQSAGVAQGSDNLRTVAHMLDVQAVRFMDRDRTHFDNMQVLVAVALGNAVFATGLSQNLAVVDSHQQCSKNAKMRSS